MRKLCTLAFVTLFVLPGCFPNPQLIRAVDQHTKVILPEYRAYVANDAALDATSKRIRTDSADALEVLIADAVGSLPQ